MATISSYAIKNPLVFYVPSALFVGYLFYMIIRKRKGERPGQEGREPEL